MLWFKKHDESESSNIWDELSQRFDWIRTAGSLAASDSLLTGNKPKRSSYVPQTKPYSIVPRSEEVSRHEQAQSGQVIYRQEDYVLAVHEMTRAALRQSVATEAITVSGQPLQMAANPESISAPATGLDIAAIHDVLTTIYEEQERAASIIPTD